MSLLHLFVNVPLAPQCHNASGSNLTSIVRPTREGVPSEDAADTLRGWLEQQDANASVWGGPGFKRSWRATSNGMEGAAALSNDSYLALDEISESDPRDIGAVVYALANGVGKQRAGRTGHARPVFTWRTSVVSSGEQTIAESMARSGFRATAGQDVRLLNIPAERKHGVWDDLGIFLDGAALANAMRSASKKYYGVAAREFLERLTRETDDLRANLEAIKVKFMSPGHGSQDDRAATRLALIALAGELAAKYGIVPWPQGAAIEAAMEMFRVWQQWRGKGNSEPRRICECPR